MDMNELLSIVSHFHPQGTVSDIRPLGTGLINDTYRVTTGEPDAPDYVLQRINHRVFRDVDGLQRNIEAVTNHIRRKLEARGGKDVDRKVLRFLSTDEGKTYWHDGTSYWRLSVFIPRTRTLDVVSLHSAYATGQTFGRFEAMLVDLPGPLVETIPDFHNMELRLRQLHQAVEADAAGRVKEVGRYLDEIEQRADRMCLAERLHREGALPKRICHCDTKVNNILFDQEGDALCVIDLDTVMPSFVFSDYGDFLRTAANTAAEDERDLDRVDFNLDIFYSFTQGYLDSATLFLQPVEIENLPYGVALFPYMQCVRFLTDYLNGDTYYKTDYPGHNLVRTATQFRLLERVEANQEKMRAFIDRYMK